MDPQVRSGLHLVGWVRILENFVKFFLTCVCTLEWVQSGLVRYFVSYQGSGQPSDRLGSGRVKAGQVGLKKSNQWTTATTTPQQHN